MYENLRIDPFFYDQPPLKFVDELKKPFYDKKPEGFNTREKEEGEVSAKGIYICKADFDDKGLLDTAYFEFERFAKLYGIDGKSYPVTIKYEKTAVFEEYRIVVDENGTVIYTADTEGARRAIIYILDELVRREGAFLPVGEIKKRPVIKARITRGFFSPTNRPPKMGDELSDDIDYYPEEYLNRLAHDGTNGIWIYTSFRALMTSEIFPEYGEGGAARIEKLRKVVKKCARYGIKVYVFAIEPMNISYEMAAKHPKVTGAEGYWGVTPICPMSEEGGKYILEATEKLFRLVPDLGGYMDITQGERVTSCAASWTFHTCPRCGKKPIGEALAYTVNLIKEGIRRAGTGAEFISWTYGHRTWKFDDIRDYVRCADSDIMLMQNFDDMGYEEQLGKTREAVDYWLSYVGPSQLFRITGEAAKKHGKHMYAKMQVCCSHELATVPYIPVPGLIFEKYKGAHEYSVEGVLQCWYFGNYPSIMSKAAGELSFMDDFSDKDGFLTRLAATYYGRSKAESVKQAWALFEEGYRNYPINIMFSYYGPMHDGVVWDLYLKPRDNMLPRSWQLLDPPDGDRIHECLWEGHSLDEAVILSDMIKEKWEMGMKALDLPETDELYTLSSALDILFKSGSNILKFFKLRRELGLEIGDPMEKLAEMRKIIELEIENSRKMIPICEADVRLGYHSEAEGFKFFPKKLLDRIAKLESTLETEFPEIEARVKAGLVPLEFYKGMKDGKIIEGAYILNASRLEDAREESFFSGGHTFKMAYDKEYIYLEVNAKTSEECKVCFEFEPLVISPGLILSSDGSKKLVRAATSHHGVFGEKIAAELDKYITEAIPSKDGCTYRITVPRAARGWTENTPIRMRVSVGRDKWKNSLNEDIFLAKYEQLPEAYGWIIPE